MKSRNAMTRRSVLVGATAVASTSLVRRPADAAVTPNGSVCPNLAAPPQLTALPQRAISLREVSAALEAGRPATLEKLTRLDGYITDAANHDIILWGLSEPDQPDLQLADFIVALRAAHGRYGQVRNGVNYITNPLISIDPDPAVFRRINALKLTSSDGQSQFEQLCKSPQTVRIEGMPRNTRVAKILVDADYRMKMVGQGTVALPITSPFPSHQQAQVQKWREEAAEGKSMGPHLNTRFWFQSGRFSYQASADADTVFMDCAQVILNDEDQMLSGNTLTASGKTDAITRAFACSWTDRMDDVYKAEPIWRDMHNIFRHFALARVMKDSDAIGRTAFDGGFFLDRYDIPNVTVPPSLPGLGHIDQYQQPGAGNSTTNLAFSVCGGVAIGFNKPLDTNPVTVQTRNSGLSVAASRPALTSAAWAVTPGLVPPPSRPPGTVEAPGSFQDLFKGTHPGIGGSNVTPL